MGIKPRGDKIRKSAADSTSLSNAIDAKQATLVSGTNIKTVNSQSLLGSGDIVISAGLGTFTKAQLDTAISDGNVVYVGDTISETASAATGTGGLVRATSPTLVTPALGTPTSGVVTNLTGTASININGTVGATTPASVAATTVTATGLVSGTGLRTNSGNGILLATDGSYGAGVRFQNLAVDGKVRITNFAATGGGYLTLTTADTFIFRNIADNAAGNITCGNLTASGTITSGPFTVASLPVAASSARATTWVTNSSVDRSAATIGTVVAGGGSFTVPVLCNGTDWRIL